jgi:flavin reductase (DIM6/NTAB) family NADH-FMN oxidoreductase RutF
MKKSLPISNNFCPQTLFLYGTYKENKKPNFGLFCWFSYYWDNGMGVMACIAEKNLTKYRILDSKIFSANLVTEKLLPIADYFGNKSGYDKDKMNIAIDIEKGHVLDVPVIAKSPVIYELEVNKTINFGDSDVFFCRIRNFLAEDYLCDDAISIKEHIKKIRPVHTTCQTYFSWDGDIIGTWGKAMDNDKKIIKFR